MNRHVGALERISLRCCAWSERWIPDAYVFAVLGVIIVAVAAIALGSPVTQTAKAFGDGFWSLIPFTMQMSFIIIGGYVVASSPPAARLIDKLAAFPSTGRGAVCWVAGISMLFSLLHWGLSMVLGSLLVRALSRRDDLDMDYRAAAAAGYLGMGSVWAMGLSSSAAQLQANPASMPPALLQITGVIPFTETIFLWQSVALTAVLIVVTLAIAWLTAPRGENAQTARRLGAVAEPPPVVTSVESSRPGEWLEHSPLLNVLIAALGVVWLIQEFATKGAALAISNLNTYNFLFVMLGLLLCWRPRVFLDAVSRSVSSVSGVLIQFPFYGGIAAMLVSAVGSDGQSIAHHLSTFFAQAANRETFPVVMGIYSAVLGFFVPSGGGKWIIEAPYVMQAANELKVHLGWAVQVYNAAEALPNLINPFWMLPLLGILKLRARDVIGYTMIQFIVHVPVVLFLLWAFGMTLEYKPPVMP
ncbi:short-chain fatty acid transporter [Steroidobacter sp. S1-65]|uniref:Short-chain fatty acid transporter n=1 Tax=Steroidobacter gossypii TaxID=2805490 RepID=A0ABS1WS88_9GAMM|nr:TIGR00366 family protein [Steroidobacter gossypii]MBM0103846.1 short-chain fatty acid transporter [Steroidobacter gossypii]